MAADLAAIERLPLPDFKRGLMPSLPVWAASQVVSLVLSQQADSRTGTHGELWTLPPDRIPTDEQRQALAAHADYLDGWLEHTPEKDDGYGRATIVLVTKMMMSLPSAAMTDDSAEAKAEAYMDALEDVPSWAVQAAIRGWHRLEYGDKFNYRWAPVPSELRTVAFLEAWKVKQRIRDLRRVISADVLFYVPAEREQEMRDKLEPLLKANTA